MICSKSLIAAIATFLLLGDVARADVAPPAHLKRVGARAVFSGLSHAKGYTLLLVEPMGPGGARCAVIKEGASISPLTYRWIAPRVVALKGEVASVDKARCAELARDKSLPRSSGLTLKTVIKKTVPATVVRSKFVISGVAGGKVMLSKAADEYIGKDGKALPASQTKGSSSSCAVAGANVELGLTLLSLLALALWRRRRRALTTGQRPSSTSA